jgi:hypothetical protein
LIPIKAKTDGAFGKRLASRIAKWASATPASARIRTNEKVDWWYMQEVGVAPYKLKPDPRGISDQMAAIWRRDKAALAFEIDGETVYADHILSHPGFPAHHMVGDAMPLIEQQGAELLRELAPQIPDNPEVLKQFVAEAAAKAKDAIRNSFEQKFSNHGSSEGKLKGQTAAQAYEENATIVTNE